MTHQYKKMLYHPYSYRITINQNPIPQQRICVLSYICLLLTKVLFQTSFKSFQYNTEGRRLSNYSIKLILCSHHRSRCKGLCQNKKHDFDQYTKRGHFCAAHMALIVTFDLLSKKTLTWPLIFFFYCKRQGYHICMCGVLNKTLFVVVINLEHVTFGLLFKTLTLFITLIQFS